MTELNENEMDSVNGGTVIPFGTGSNNEPDWFLRWKDPSNEPDMFPRWKEPWKDPIDDPNIIVRQFPSSPKLINGQIIFSPCID